MRTAAIVLSLGLAAGALCGNATLAADAKPASKPAAAPKPPVKSPALPRTPDGHPDLQGVTWFEPYMATVQVGLGMPSELVLPEDKAKVAFARMAKLITSLPAINIDAETVAVFEDSKGFPLVRGERHTRLLVSPANGQLPFTPAVKAEAAQLMATNNHMNNPEERPYGERCLSLGSLAPMAFTSPLHTIQFVQTPDHVGLHVEYGDEMRVIPFAAAHGPAALGLANGDSIARWDGDTLVVETTNMPAWARDRPFPIGIIVSPESKVIEKFTRLSASELLYQFTVEDPKIYSAPWLGEYSFYAADFITHPSSCHEGNYAMANILAGAREDEKRAAAKAAAK